MATARGLGRLFWKFFLAQWLATGLTVVCISTYFRLAGVSPHHPEDPLLFGVIPIVPLGSALLTMFVSSAGLAWYLSRPLRELSWALRRVADGHLETRVVERMGSRRDEVVDVAAEFDRMALRLQELTKSRVMLIHDVSHELRSPLARLQVAVGLLRQEPSQRESMLGRIEREVGRLDGLIDELMTWHRLEAGASMPPTTRVDMVELLHAIAEDAQFEAAAIGKSVVIEAPGAFVTDVHAELLYRALENVVRNAVKFTAAGTEVGISAHLNADAWVCIVEDRGPGVPASMLETIFEPFARVAGSEGVHGVGLGLAIARRAISLHGGTISAELREGGGLCFRLALPQR
ncbi:ATP-binding protein [Roseateles sp. SL47]|uniref:HAMP domain-containing sensor histidine kinase n=1 Tax=Roseateles sp. SL47 TaxID=2995138 RepID=UPI0022707C9B|nr:ATP-binding protein [Roseateles sp. SL47]WAC74253.1 ATP-binding protein [Roseateles sp. SL47]